MYSNKKLLLLLFVLVLAGCNRDPKVKRDK